MRMVGRLLSLLGGQGPVLLVAALCAGVSSPVVGSFGYSLLPVSSFLITLSSFLTAGLAPSDAKVRNCLIGAVLIWIGVGLPLAAAALWSLLPLDPSLRTGILLSLLSPPVGSAAAIAAMLGLKPRLALFVTIALTLLAPISIPGFAAVLGLDLTFNVGTMALRLLAIIGPAAMVAFLALRFRERLIAILPDQRSASGVAVIGMIILAFATSRGILMEWHSSPHHFEEILTIAMAINLGLCVLATLMFFGVGLRLAGSIGLVTGNRNVALAWVAASSGLPASTEGYVVASVTAVFVLPLIVKIGTLLVLQSTRLSARL